MILARALAVAATPNEPHSGSEAIADRRAKGRVGPEVSWVSRFSPVDPSGDAFSLRGPDMSSYLRADMWLPVCRTGEGLVWRNDVSSEPFPEICAFSTLGFRVLLFFRAKYRRYLFWGHCASQLPFILGGSDARDVGCGMWAAWLAAPTEIRFPPARKSKHSQSAVCAAHPRSPTAALKPIWDAGWSKPRLPLLRPPLLSSTFCF